MSERPRLMTTSEHHELAQAEGGTFAAWEAVDSLWRLWLYDHPDEERELHEVTGTPEFDAWAETIPVEE